LGITKDKAIGPQSDCSILTLKGFQWLLPASGILIGLILLTVSGLADTLAIHHPVEQRPVGAFVALMMAAGGIYTAAAFYCRQIPDSKTLRNWIVVIAVGLRLTMVTGTPILEDDHYRYLWDGALVAHGQNPYQHAPGDARAGISRNDPSPLSQLAKESGIILERVNYPWLRTIYPPVAQAAFGIAHHLSPWSLWAWRLVLSIFELAALFILCRMGVPIYGLLIYGWNPLLIKEVYNSCHVDALMLPVFLVAVVAVRRNRPITATAALGLATGIKLWPVLLMPMVWRRLTDRPLVLFKSLTLFAAFLSGALLPLVSGLDWTSGLAAYSRNWEMNDALYTLIAWSVDGVTALLPLSQTWAALLPRLVAAAAVLGGVGLLSWRREMAVEQQFLIATTLLFMLSPTQFPWYYLWLLPFVALHPHPALIFYTAFLPLYYLRPSMEFHGHTEVFDHGIVWFQHGPVIIWLTWDWVVRPKKKEK
jgi:alpha-1,6-mannosyltransferase